MTHQDAQQGDGPDERQAIRKVLTDWLGPQRLSLHLSKDIDHMVMGVIAYQAAVRAQQGDGHDVLRAAAGHVASALRFHNKTPSGETKPCLPGCIACAALVGYNAALRTQPADRAERGLPLDVERLVATLRDRFHEARAGTPEWRDGVRLGLEIAMNEVGYWSDPQSPTGGEG